MVIFCILHSRNIPGALVGFLALLSLIALLLGTPTAVRILLTVVFLLVVVVAFFSILEEMLTGFDSFTTEVGFAVITAFSAASLI